MPAGAPGGPLRPLPALLLFAASLAVSHLCHALYFSGGQTFEFCHYAEISRNILQGRGFSTRTFWPAELAALGPAAPGRALDAPPLSRNPLFAYWSAFWMRLAGVNDYGMALGNMAALALWVVALYWTGLRLFDRRTALCSACLWLSLPILQAGYVQYGYAELLYGPMLLVLLVRLSESSADAALQTRGHLLAIGALSGLAYLQRYSFALWLPLLLALPLLPGTRAGLKAAAWLFCGFLLPVLPWTLWWRLSVGAAPSLPALQLAEGVLSPAPAMDYRLYTLWDLASMDAFTALLSKAWQQFNRSLGDLPGMWNLELLFPFSAAALLCASGPRKRFALLALAFFGWQIAAFSFLHYENLVFFGHRYSLWFSPILLLFAVRFLLDWTDKHGKALALIVLGLQLQMAASLYFLRYMDLRSAGPALDVSSLPELRYAKESLPEGARLLTNLPTQAAWYSDRPAVNIPNRIEDALAMIGRHRLGYLLLSAHPSGELGRFPEWIPVLREDPRALTVLGAKVEARFPGAVLFKLTLE